MNVPRPPGRALVAGAAGFIGSHLCDALLARGWSVLAVDSYLTADGGNLAHLGGRPGFEFRRADVSQPLPDIGRVSHVLHFASPASPVDYARHPIETLRVGTAGTERLLELAAEQGSRFLLASTSEVYGDPLVHPQAESYWGNVNPVGPRSCYDEAKRCAEAYTVAYRRARGVDTRIIRIFNTYGPRMRLDDGRAVPSFINAVLRSEPLPVHGDGSQTRSLCYVDDLVTGILTVLDGDDAGPINLGNPVEITILELAERVAALAGGESRIEFHPLPADDPVRRRPDIARARALGWEPKIELDEGLRRTLASFQR